MRIIPTFLRRSVIKNKIDIRQRYRDKLVTISPNLSSQDLQVCKNSESALKAFAHKNKIGLNITNGGELFEKMPMIEIFNLARYTGNYKVNNKVAGIERCDGLIPLTTIIGDIKDKTDLLKTLKTALKQFEGKRVSEVKSKKEFVKIVDRYNTAPPG